MELAIWRSSLDLALAVLCWLVQLVIYPSFKRIDSAKLQQWHRQYTFRVSFVVVPLMFLQLAIMLLQLFLTWNYRAIAALLLVALCWLSTFLQVVPLHRKIEVGVYDEDTLSRLVLSNWPRTLLWTVVFLLEFPPLRIH